MWMQTGRCEGYKVRGLQEQRGVGWRIITWPEGKNEPQNVYWAKEGVFFRLGPDLPPSHTEWQKASFGAAKDSVDESEKKRCFRGDPAMDAQIGSPLWTIARRPGELLRTDPANGPCEYLRMKKTKNPAKSARTTLSSVKREMLEPRLTASVRNAIGNEQAPIEKSSASSRQVWAPVTATSKNRC